MSTGLGRTTIIDELDVESIRCVGDYVLVEVYERLKTRGGLHLVEGKATECLIGKVVSVGKELPNSYGVKGYPIGVEKGDVILTMEYVGERVENSSGKYRFLHAHGIWAKVKMKDLDSFDIAELEPLFSFMLVEPIDDEKTKGGILLAAGHDSQDQLRRAKVLKIGPGQWNAKKGIRIPVPMESGLDILMLRYAGADVEVNGKKLRVIDYADVKVILDD